MTSTTRSLCDHYREGVAVSTISYWALIIALMALCISVCAMRHSFTNRKALRHLLAGMPQDARDILNRAYDGKEGYDV